MNKNVKTTIIAVVFVLCIVNTAIITYYFGENEISGSTMENSWQDYDKMMTKGWKAYSEALGNSAYAGLSYDDATVFYDDPELAYSWVKLYADRADTYYIYSSDNYRTAKAYFNQAKNIAPNYKTFQLTQLYVNVCDIGAELMDEMHQACEYFSSACGYYGNEWWDVGDNELEKMNEYIVNHDELVPDFNDYLSDIEALLETF